MKYDIIKTLFLMEYNILTYYIFSYLNKYLIEYIIFDFFLKWNEKYIVLQYLIFI